MPEAKASPVEFFDRSVEREILRVVGELGPAAEAVGHARREVLKWASNRTSGDLPLEAWDGASFEHRNCAAVSLQDGEYDIWAFGLDDPDKSAPQRIWSTEVLIARRAEDAVKLAARQTATSRERILNVTPAVPVFFRRIEAGCGLASRGRSFTQNSRPVGTEEQAEALMDWMVDPQRRLPICVLSEAESTSGAAEKAPLIDPEILARNVLGLGEVYVLSAQQSWRLTERFGKRLSVFGGAARFYMPGFDEDANPFGEHRLFLPEQASLKQVGALFQQAAARESLRRIRLGKDLWTYADLRSRIAEKRLEERRRDASSDDANRLKAAIEEIEALKQQLKEADDAALDWLEEKEAAEARAKEAETQVQSLKYRIQQLLNRPPAASDEQDEDLGLPETWGPTFQDWCDEKLEGRVTLSPRARREVKNPLFEDAAQVARCLLWLAGYYRDARASGTGRDLRIVIESGIKNDACGGDSFQFLWGKHWVSVDWHIKTISNTRDPKRCLRIYYFWDEDRQEVVIASMPAHIANEVT